MGDIRSQTFRYLEACYYEKVCIITWQRIRRQIHQLWNKLSNQLHHALWILAPLQSKIDSQNVLEFVHILVQ